MPKQVDHQARRQQIAEAVCRLVGSQGLEAVSLRHVAAEAGISMGRVQHYFTTKDEMLLFAFRTLSERVEQRIGAAIASVPPPRTARSLLRAFLMELLPLTDQGRAEAPVWIAFLARSVTEPRLAATLHDDSQALRGFIADQIRTAQRSGDAVPDLDPDREAVTLIALVDGLMTHLLLGQADAPTAVDTVDYHLDRIFPRQPEGS